MFHSICPVHEARKVTSLLARRIGASLARRVEFLGPGVTPWMRPQTRKRRWHDGGPGRRERCYRSVLA